MSKKTSKNDRWFPAAQIQPNTHQMMASVVKYFFDYWPKHGLGNKIKKYFTYFKGDYSEMWYKHREFDAAAEFLAKKMINHPKWALKIVDDVEHYSDEFFRTAKKFRILSFSSMTVRQMMDEWKKVTKWQYLSHGVGSSVSWHADADKERITKYVMNMVGAQIHRQKIGESLPKVFSILTTSPEISFNQHDELEFLQLKNHRQLIKHWQKWVWLPYGYKGPELSLPELKDRFNELKNCGKSCDILLQELKGKIRNVAKEQKRLLTALNFNKRQLDLIKLAQRLVFIKDYRKGALYHGMYCYEPFLIEVSRRLKMTLDQVRAMSNQEIADYLLKGVGPLKAELNSRNKESVAICDGKNYVILIGNKARKFFNSIPKEEIAKAKDVSELRGTCASPGKAQGIVKIIEVPGDMKKMNVGDILVSETTYPSLVPAMKKAAAIVTNAGGLTCHAAIVARELGIPCVVGTHMANRVLKDGDKVEVDASNGLVRKI